MRVAKSGRTTGLTCGGVSAIDLDVAVDYFADCAETRPYTTKIFTRQVGVSGDHFSDAGDSGSLVVNAANAEPVGLFFAGGTDAAHEQEQRDHGGAEDRHQRKAIEIGDHRGLLRHLVVERGEALRGVEIPES